MYIKFYNNIFYKYIERKRKWKCKERKKKKEKGKREKRKKGVASYCPM